MKKFAKLLTTALLLCALSFCFACTSPNDKNVNDSEIDSTTDNNTNGDGNNTEDDKNPTQSTETEDVEKINKNSTFELKFLEDVENKDLSGFDYHPGFGVTGYSNPKYSGSTTFSHDIIVQYDVTAYPDYADGGHFVTSIYCSDPEVTFFDGYTVASGKELVQALTEAGYQTKLFGTSASGLPIYDAIKGNIKICYIQNDSFYIRYDVSNRDGIMF